MALTRKLLSAMGITAEQVDQIIEAHTETVNGLKEQITNLSGELETAKADAAKLPGVQKELDGLKEQINGKDYDALKKEYDDYKADVQKRSVERAKEKVLRGVLSDLNISDKGADKVIKYMGVDSVELDEEGKPKNADSIRETVKTEWSELIPKIERKGAETQNPPGSETGGNGGKTREEIMAIKDRAERQKAIADNIELFQ